MEVLSKIIPNPASSLFWAKVPDLNDPMIKECGIQSFLPSDIGLEQKQREWLGSRFLLKKAGIPLENIVLEGNKPILADGPFFSLSHTSDWVAAAVNPIESTGVDVEKISSRILKIKERFTNEIEWGWIPHPESLEDLVLIWSAKEALFKKYGGETAFFNKNLVIEGISKEKQLIKATVRLKEGEKIQTLEYITIEDHFLVYTL